jgi:DNA-binding CsgD family transcriptional regulator
MFAERAVGARPNFALTDENVEIVTQICRRLDGIPLAIELAAARTRVLSASQISSALDDRFRLLTGGSRTVMPRQQTLRASVQWSFDLLRDHERVVLRRLSTFAGGFSLDAAEAVAAGEGIDTYDVLDLLTSLVDKSLVVADDTNGGTRYRLLETIRQFGRERLLDAGEGPSVRDRHLAWFLAFAEQAKPNLVTRDQLRWLADLEQEHDNLRAALQWASGGALARLVTALTFYWSMRGLFREGIEWLDRAYEGVDEPGPIEVEAMWGAAHLRAYGGLARAGFSIASEAEAHARRLGDPRLTGRALNTRGFMIMWADPRAGRALLEESVAYAREANDLWCLCDSLQLAAWTWMLSGTPRAGRPFIDEAMTVTRETGDRAARAWQLVTIGMELGHHGEMSAAAAPLEQAAELAESLGDPWMFGWAAAHLGYLEMYRGRYADAHAWLDRGLNFARESGARGPLGLLANMVAMVQLAEGDPASAIETNAGVMALRRGRADAWGYACCVLVLGAALAKVGDFTAARGRGEEGLECAERLDSPFMRAWSRWTLGVIAFLEGDIDVADEEFHATLAHASSGPYPNFIIDALDGVASVSGRRDDHAVAVRIGAAVERAREVFEYVRPALLDAEVAHARKGAREALGEVAFDGAWHEGSQLSLEDAVEYASRARGERRRPTAGWKSLTPTELQVIRYLVEGLTNPQIGERMFISRGTVKTHLAHAFAKLGVATRSELAAEAAKRGLGS